MTLGVPCFPPETVLMYPTLSLLEQAFCDNLEKPYFNRVMQICLGKLPAGAEVNLTLDVFSHADFGNVDAVEKHLKEKQKLHQA